MLDLFFLLIWRLEWSYVNIRKIFKTAINCRNLTANQEQRNYNFWRAIYEKTLFGSKTAGISKRENLKCRQWIQRLGLSTTIVFSSLNVKKLTTFFLFWKLIFFLWFSYTVKCRFLLKKQCRKLIELNSFQAKRIRNLSHDWSDKENHLNGKY